MQFCDFFFHNVLRPKRRKYKNKPNLMLGLGHGHSRLRRGVKDWILRGWVATEKRLN